MIKFFISLFSLSVISLTFFKMGKIYTYGDNLKTFLKKFGICLVLSFVLVIKFIVMTIAVPIIKLITKAVNNLNGRLMLDEKTEYVEDIINEQ